jgi:hypothetical protein
MLNEKELLTALGIAIEDEGFGIDSSTEVTENWDSLGQLAILATLAKYTEGKSDALDDIPRAQTAKELMSILRANGLIA